MEYNSRMRCAGKVGVVTGCTAGIGLATIAEELDQRMEQLYTITRQSKKM